MEDRAKEAGSAKATRTTANAALIAALGALFAAFTPIVVELMKRDKPVIDAQAQPVSLLRYSCSQTIAFDNSVSRTIEFPLQNVEVVRDSVQLRYPVLLQVFFKRSMTEPESYAMFPLPARTAAVNPMNIVTDGQTVKIAIAEGNSLYAIFEPASGAWQEVSSGFAYACAVF